MQQGTNANAPWRDWFSHKWETHEGYGALGGSPRWFTRKAMLLSFLSQVRKPFITGDKNVYHWWENLLRYGLMAWKHRVRGLKAQDFCAWKTHNANDARSETRDTRSKSIGAICVNARFQSKTYTFSPYLHPCLHLHFLLKYSLLRRTGVGM